MLYTWKKIVLLLFAPHFSKASCAIISQLPIPLKAHQLGYGKDPNIIYLFGGFTTGTQATNNIYKWNVTAPMTFTTLSLTTPTSRFISYSNNAVSINDKIYFVGTDDGSWESDIYIFDVITEMWIDNANIYKPPQPALYGCLTANTTHLFFIGGETDETWLDRLQIYNINSNKWFDEQIDIAPIKDNGWNYGYCEFINEYLYVFGGKVNDGNRINHILKWNPTEEWRNIGYLPSEQSFGIAVRNNHIIYLIGGYSDSTLDSIHEFNTNIDEITNIYEMTQGLEYLTAGIINNKLYVFGGFGSDFSDDVQICDIVKTLEPTAVNPTTAAPNTKAATTIYPINPTTTTPNTKAATTIYPTTINPTTTTPNTKTTTTIYVFTVNPTTTSSRSATTSNHEPNSTNDVIITTKNTAETLTTYDYNDLPSIQSTTNLMIITLGAVVVVICVVMVSAYFLYNSFAYRKHVQQLDEDGNIAEESSEDEGMITVLDTKGGVDTKGVKKETVPLEIDNAINNKDEGYIDVDEIVKEMKRTKGALSAMNDRMFKENVDNSVAVQQVMIDDIVDDMEHGETDAGNEIIDATIRQYMVTHQ